MLTRLGIALLMVGLCLGAYTIGTRWQTARLRRRPSASSILEGLRPGVPAVIYFWSETCAPCKLVQTPALEQLQAEVGKGGVQIVAIDALEQPDLADEWGVLGLPTTFIVDEAGQPRRVNHGVVQVEQLKWQLGDSERLQRSRRENT
jgi:thiol-disulfide isomerase/thioredoxin